MPVNQRLRKICNQMLTIPHNTPLNYNIVVIPTIYYTYLQYPLPVYQYGSKRSDNNMFGKVARSGDRTISPEHPAVGRGGHSRDWSQPGPFPMGEITVYIKWDSIEKLHISQEKL